ncbi:hypothetical protein PT974_12309 [Cladobotryum mycophilum]|uniref:Uncharacterized protein n=1 Tax=Cladobotryum mycophilum TaxID=491253 RepID=A0ABR0S7M7_9HYPO
MRTNDTVCQMLAKYKGHRKRNDTSDIMRDITEKEAFLMVDFYQFIVQPLVEGCSRVCLSKLAERANRCEESVRWPTGMEETRLFRGLYRFQLPCNLFGTTHLGTQYIDFDTKQVFRLYLLRFHHWELAEIVCVYEFARRKYIQAFKVLCAKEEKPLGRQLVDLPVDGSDSYYGHILHGTISRGLELLNFLHFSVQDEDHLVRVIPSQMAYPAGEPFQHHFFYNITDDFVCRFWYEDSVPRIK